jgi:hypothetical protein
MADNLDLLLASLDGSPTGAPSPAARARGAPSSSPAPAAIRGSQRGGDAPPAKPQAPASPRTKGRAPRSWRASGTQPPSASSTRPGAVVDSLGLTPGRENVWNSHKSFGDVLSGNIAKNRAILHASSSQHPYAYTGGQVVGALAIPAGASARGALQVAKVGAVQGAAYGAGSGEGLGDRAKKAVVGGTVGAVVGAALGKATEVAGKGVRKLLGRSEGAVGGEAAPATEHTVEGWSEPNLQGERHPDRHREAHRTRHPRRRWFPFTPRPPDDRQGW